jgi:hypothetical protein
MTYGASEICCTQKGKVISPSGCDDETLFIVPAFHGLTGLTRADEELDRSRCAITTSLSRFCLMRSFHDAHWLGFARLLPTVDRECAKPECHYVAATL